MSNLSNRIQELEEQVASLQKYITIRDGLWVTRHLSELDNHLINYDNVGDDNLKMQLEFDNLMMCRARLQEDFLEYCRRAALQLEGMTDWALQEVEKRDRAKIEQAWVRLQNSKEERWRTHYTRDECPEPIGKAKAMDSLELCFDLFFDPDYREKRTLVNDQFNCLQRTLQARNVASHRQKQSDVLTRMSHRLRNFYDDRDTNYNNIAEYIGVVKASMLRCLT